MPPLSITMLFFAGYFRCFARFSIHAAIGFGATVRRYLFMPALPFHARHFAALFCLSLPIAIFFFRYRRRYAMPPYYAATCCCHAAAFSPD
jgi:hypothetical protein